MPASSFISEHTAEYYLTNSLFNLFRDTPHNVIPFYYWKSREGANQSKASGQNEEFRLVAIYPRRPKINEPNQPEVLIKFNQLLFDTASIFNSYDIPVFSGVPLSSSFVNLSSIEECAWFYLNPFIEENDDILLTVSLNNGSSNTDELRNLELVSNKKLVDLMIKKTVKRKWTDCISSINDVRFRASYSDLIPNSLFSSLGYYKPFYLAIH